MDLERNSEGQGGAASLPRPLVTFALIAYNQEPFIGEAVEAALAQTWSPLEVILSDDASSDATFDVMRRIAGRYSGPHEVSLVRNAMNLGIGGHVNRIAELAKGELIVIAAGDDVSLPARVEHLVRQWIEGGQRAHSIYSAATVIDAKGSTTGKIDYPPREMRPVEAIESYMDGVMGCSHAWSREVFRAFGPMLPDTTCEDRVIALRSMLLGGIAYCPKPLVRYRIHHGTLSDHALRFADRIHFRTIDIHRRNLNIAQNYLRDLRRAAGDSRISGSEWLREGIVVAERMAERLADKVDFHTGDTRAKWRLILKYILLDPGQACRWLVAMLLPRAYLKVQKKNLGVGG
jgi:glycosyltransferase involved in cell wall biosynthesis